MNETRLKRQAETESCKPQGKEFRFYLKNEKPLKILSKKVT